MPDCMEVFAGAKITARRWVRGVPEATWTSVNVANARNSAVNPRAAALFRTRASSRKELAIVYFLVGFAVAGGRVG